MPEDKDSHPLAGQLSDRVREWISRVAPRIRGLDGTAELRIVLSQPQWDDDEELQLEARIQETFEQDEIIARVPGLKGPNDV